MLNKKENTQKNTSTYICIFIHKITARNMQDLIVFLQKNNFQMKRLTKNSHQKNFALNITNSNFLLESHCDIQVKQLQNLVSFLKKSTNINSIFFNNQVLNLERVLNLQKQTQLHLWKQISTLSI